LKPTPAAGIKFDVAGKADDAGIRRLLRETPMRGQISLSLEREPDYFTDADIPGEVKQTIVARDAERVATVGTCTIRHRFVNGKPARVGYLGGLRLDARYEGRFDILRRGYAYFRELQASDPADFYFTSIATDNLRARSFLERGIRGMPHYEFVGEFVTLIIPTRSVRVRTSSDSDPEIRPGFKGQSPDRFIQFLNEANAAFQFSLCWTAQELSTLETLGLSESDFCLHFKDGELAGCGALWDQRRFKQAVVRGYTRTLAFARPVLNATSLISGRPLLPAIGAVLSNAFVSHLAARNGDAHCLTSLIANVAATARTRGIELLTLGFAANDFRLESVCRQFRCRKYRSRIYVVRWPDIGGSARELDGRFMNPEAALL
jgi:hypothetical protein